MGEPGVSEIVVHIGLPKTGTTYVQHALFAARESLQAEGFLYAGRKTNLNVLAAAFAADLDSTLLLWKWRRTRGELIGAAEAAVADVELQVRSSTARVVIISAEVLSVLVGAEVSAFVAWLRTLCPRIRAVAYVRDTSAWASSYAAQLIVAGFRLADILERPTAPGFRRRLEPWLRELGDDGLRVRSYDRVIARPGGVLGDVLHQMGIPEGCVRPEPGSRLVNRSISAEGVLILEALRDQFRPVRGSEFDRACARAIKEVPGTPFRLPDTALARIVAESAADTEWLRATFRTRVRNQVARASGEPSVPWGQATVAELGRIVGELVASRLDADDGPTDL